MTKSRVQHFEVIQHYEELAERYSHRSNRVCDEAYFELVQRFSIGKKSILELGAGSTDLLDRLNCSHSVACDLSAAMLAKRAQNHVRCVEAAAESLPFSKNEFEMVYCINLLEHVSNLNMVITEAARVMKSGGTFLAVTPNGNWEALLDFAERRGWKIPEGPHRFLRYRELQSAIGKVFSIQHHQTFLVLPVVSSRLATWIDRFCFAANFNLGFFQYIVARKA